MYIGIRIRRYTWYTTVEVYVAYARWRCTGYTQMEVYVKVYADGGIRGGIRLWRDHHMNPLGSNIQNVNPLGSTSYIFHIMHQYE